MWELVGGIVRGGWQLEIVVVPVVVVVVVHVAAVGVVDDGQRSLLLQNNLLQSHVLSSLGFGPPLCFCGSERKMTWRFLLFQEYNGTRSFVNVG